MRKDKFSILRAVKTQKPEDNRGDARMTFPSFASIVLLFHCFFLFLHFPSNLSVSRISTEVRALWMARVSSTLLFSFCVFHPALLVPRVFPDRRARPRPAGDFQSQLPPSLFRIE